MNVWLDISAPKVIDSRLSGVTLFDSWEQIAADARRTEDIITFNCYGIWSYKLIIDGIGTFFTYKASFSGDYNVTTGQGELYIL